MRWRLSAAFGIGAAVGSCTYEPGDLPNSCVVTADDELCDSLDNDCDGTVDEDCDGDGDGYCGADRTVSRDNPVGCPASLSGAGDDCDDGDPLSHPNASEACDGNDTACAGAIAADELDADGDGYVGCAPFVDSQGDNPGILDGGDCADDPGQETISPARGEGCNGIDDNCAAGTDEGCDDDGDGYCDSGMWVSVAAPASCPQSGVGQGDDCNDGSALANPGFGSETCGDGIDNDCDGAMDFQDDAACPFLAISITQVSGGVPSTPQPGQPVLVPHGTAITLSATLSLSSSGAPPTWSIVAANGNGCLVADLTLGLPVSSPTSTSVGLDVGNAAPGCLYTVEVSLNAYTASRVELLITNAAPRLTVTNGAYDPATDVWTIRGAAGRPVNIDLRAEETNPENDTPYTFALSGADAAGATCGSCTTNAGASGIGSASFVFASAATARSTPYDLTVSVSDNVTPAASTTLNVRVVVDTCVWVGNPPTGLGNLDGSSPADAYGSIQVALDAAANLPGTNVCVTGSGPYVEPPTPSTSLFVPIGTNTPSLLGGFDSNGNPTGNRPTVVVDASVGVSFATGYDGVVRALAFQNSRATGTGNVTVQVADASPTFEGCTIDVGSGAAPVGLRVVDDGVVASPTQVLFVGLGGVNAGLGASIDRPSSTVVSDAVAVVVDRLNGGDALFTANGTRMIRNAHNLECTGTCIAVLVKNGASAVLTANEQILGVAAAGQTAIAIDLQGARDTLIDGNRSITNNEAWTRLDVGVVIRLSQSRRVTISNNLEIGHWGSGGLRLGAAIADGSVDRDGVLSRGDSRDLLVVGNDRIGPSEYPSWLDPSCSAGVETGEGPDVAAGILLVGTETSEIRDNGRPKTGWASGIHGGVTHMNWSDSARRLPPISAGIFLIDTDRISIADNELVSGGMRLATSGSGCAPALRPTLYALLDGLPPQPGLSGGAAVAELASTGLSVERNGMSCLLQPEVGGQLTTCVVVELNDPPALSGPLLVNNVLASTYGNTLITLRQNGGAGVRAFNNHFLVDLLPTPGNSTPIYKWNVVLEGVAAGGVTFANNIVETRAHTFDIVTERLVVRDNSGTITAMLGLLNNLFWVQGTAPNRPYIRLVGAGASGTDFDASQLDNIPGLVTGNGNLASLPVTTQMPIDWQQTLTRVLLGSPAVDRGLPVAPDGPAPASDIDGELRPKGPAVDIGPDEL